MKSIRGALLTYFFFVVVATLGAVSLLAYENTYAILRGWESTRADLLQRQYAENCKNECDKLDGALATNVRALASVARLQTQWSQPYRPVVALLGNIIDPASRTFAPVWAAGQNTSLYRQMHLGGEPLQQPSFDEEKLRHFVEVATEHNELGQVKEYFQINRRNLTWRSPSLGDNSLPYVADQVSAMLPYDSIKDEFELRPGVPVRRLAIKTPMSRLGPGSGAPRNSDRPRNDAFRGTPAVQPRQERPRNPGSATLLTPSIFVQCAAETSDRDAAVATLKSSLKEDLSNLQVESQATLASFRTKLLLINLATMGATALGCLWLVQLGLVPLRRLSEAVSKVSPNDLRLPYEEKNLPRELQPIVDRLNATFDELRRAFAREKQAAADISHELRTPLAALKTTIEVALKKNRSPEEYRETLQDCHDAGQQMNQLVERLLTLARLDAGVDILRPSIVDVAALTEQCTALVRPLAEANGLDLLLERNGPITLNTDPNKFREIVTNLLHNAIAYNRPKGQVAVSIHSRQGKLKLEVKDTGIGISEDAVSHIFDRFYRVDSSRHAEGMHSGLGLSIVKGYVDLMGGNIKVDSTLGRGSTFRIELPLPADAGHSGPMNEAERMRSQS